jgi:hypothetical protein
MDKGKLHHFWIKYRYITLFVPVALIIISLLIATFSLRDNNLKMLELKEAVISADANDGDVEKALQDLRAHVNSHMNTRLRPQGSTEPPIQLVNRYEKLVALQQANANVDSTVQRLLQEGQAQCSSLAVSLRNQCIKDYFVANGGGEAFIKLPPKELYTFDFASPTWTPDRAGLSLLVLAVSTVLLILRLLAGVVIKRQVN